MIWTVDNFQAGLEKTFKTLLKKKSPAQKNAVYTFVCI